MQAEFRNQIPRPSKADALGTLIEKLLSPTFNWATKPVLNGDGSVKHLDLDKHGMSTVFKQRIPWFYEECDEEAGDHMMPREGPRAGFLNHSTRAIDVTTEAASGELDLFNEFCTRLIPDVVTGELKVLEAASRLRDEIAADNLHHVPKEVAA